MAAFNINDFRAALKQDGARPTLFQIILAAPAFALAAGVQPQQLSFMAKATQIPGSTIGTIELPYFGRKIKVAGDRTVSDWPITVINDATFDLFGGFEFWVNAMAQTSTRADAQRVLGATSSPSSYVGQATVNHFGLDGSIIRQYVLHNVWPSDLSGIQLSWEANNTVEEFNVNLNMDWFEVVPPGLGAN